MNATILRLYVSPLSKDSQEKPISVHQETLQLLRFYLALGFQLSHRAPDRSLFCLHWFPPVSSASSNSCQTLVGEVSVQIHVDLEGNPWPPEMDPSTAECTVDQALAKRMAQLVTSDQDSGLMTRSNQQWKLSLVSGEPMSQLKQRVFVDGGLLGAAYPHRVLKDGSIWTADPFGNQVLILPATTVQSEEFVVVSYPTEVASSSVVASNAEQEAATGWLPPPAVSVSRTATGASQVPAKKVSSASRKDSLLSYHGTATGNGDAAVVTGTVMTQATVGQPTVDPVARATQAANKPLFPPSAYTGSNSALYSDRFVASPALSPQTSPEIKVTSLPSPEIRLNSKADSSLEYHHLRSQSHASILPPPILPPLRAPKNLMDDNASTTNTDPFNSDTSPAIKPRQIIQPPSYRRKIAVLTSGGDSPGMNAAVRAVVRTALVRACDVFAIMEGYQGLVEGGKRIRKMVWEDVQGILSQGGTIIGTARCAAFRGREGRLKAVKNLVVRGIDALIVIGGDGSLTGANLLRSEWRGLLDELMARQEITAVQAEQAAHLSIVGLVGSIDNDMATTDVTIGAVSSLHRICEAVDSISSTAISHQRCFVVEVMGRNCGWLALMAGIGTGADWLFIPEHPPEDGWEDVMCKTLQKHREMGKRKSIIIVAEGAIDRNLQPIRAEFLKDLITKRLNVDTRVTTLGHVQRGGSPAMFDRYLATIQGIEAVEAVLKATPESEAPLIGLSENRVTVQPLMAAVEKTRAVAEAISKKDFDLAMRLRDPQFISTYDGFVSTLGGGCERAPENKRIRVAFVHTGAPAGGMNTATRAAVRYALNRGHSPFVVNNGFAGLIAGDIRPVTWMDVESWSNEGGSKLGTNRAQPSEDFGMCAYQLQKHGIQALMIIGGFEAFTALSEMAKVRDVYPAFCIPLVLIPATISNNVPGTELSLGSDTALNVIIEACDRLRQSAYSSRKRVFVVEVQGGHCGYLATLAGLACGATCAYIPEEGISLRTIADDCNHLIRMFKQGPNQGRVILRNECVSSTYTTETISSIFREEGQGVYDSRSCILGHIQQGDSPSPFDRVYAHRMAIKSMQYIEELAFASIDEKTALTGTDIFSTAPTIDGEEKLLFSPNFGRVFTNIRPELKSNEWLREVRFKSVTGSVYTPQKEAATVICVRGTNVLMRPIEELIDETDFKNRKSKETSWWKHLNQWIRVLAKYGFYDDEN